MSDYKMMSCNQCCHTGKDCDVCVSPGCGEPENLSIYSPIIYDEVGINLCRTITIPDNNLRSAFGGGYKNIFRKRLFYR